MSAQDVSDPATESTRSRKVVRSGGSLLWCMVLAACGGSAPETGSRNAPAATEEAVVNFSNFVEAVAPETLPSFTAETGIKVNYDTYELNQVLETRLLAGHSGLDVVVPSSHYLGRQIPARIYQKLDKNRLPNLKHLDEAILQELTRDDPGNEFAVPYVWGTFGIGFNAAMVERALGGPPPESWAFVFDPKNAARLKQCGIIINDVPYLMVGLALLYLGRDPGSSRAEDINAAMDVLMAIRPYVRDITSATMTQPVVDGQACVAMGVVSNEIYLAQKLARENSTKLDIRYMIPKEGSLLWIDTLAVPVDAPHPGNAHRLIDFLMRPNVIARVTESVGAANANTDATSLVRTELRDDPIVYPDDATRTRLHVPASLTAEYSRHVNREFTRFRTGQ